MSEENLYKKLYKMSSKLVSIESPDKIKDIEFSNMFAACAESKPKYCRGRKLIISKGQLVDYLHIMTADILNPLKSKWIFSNLLVDKTVNFFKFIKRPFETITIQSI